MKTIADSRNELPYTYLDEAMGMFDFERSPTSVHFDLQLAGQLDLQRLADALVLATQRHRMMPGPAVSGARPPPAYALVHRTPVSVQSLAGAGLPERPSPRCAVCTPLHVGRGAAISRSAGPPPWLVVAPVDSGVVSLSHCWGGLPEDSMNDPSQGGKVNQQISNCLSIEPINAMTRMTGIPVNIQGEVAAA